VSEELERCRALLAEAVDELRNEGREASLADSETCSTRIQLGKFAFSDAKRLFRQHPSDSQKLGLSKTSPVCTENLVRVDDVTESPKLAG
jgi:hypothetical protein